MSDNKQRRDAEQADAINQNNASDDQPIEVLDPEEVEVADVGDTDNENERERLEGEILKLNAALEEEKKKYLYLYAEFDNFRKRTIKEKSDLIRNGGEQAFKGLLSVVDDFERGLQACHKEDDKGLCEGFELIYQKLKKYLAQNGVKEFGPDDTDFDADRHEAISAVPAPTPEQKGKILDTVEKGYTINDKVLRHAKVVVGQ